MDSKADEIFRIAPKDALPPDSPTVFLEVDGQPHCLIREDTPLPEAVAGLNQLATHLIRHGLWRPQSDGPIAPKPRHIRPAS